MSLSALEQFSGYRVEKQDTERGYPYFVLDEHGITLGEGESPLQAAATAASSLYQTGSAFWHQEIAQILMQSDMDVINFGSSPWVGPEDELRGF